MAFGMSIYGMSAYGDSGANSILWGTSLLQNTTLYTVAGVSVDQDSAQSRKSGVAVIQTNSSFITGVPVLQQMSFPITSGVYVAQTTETQIFADMLNSNYHVVPKVRITIFDVQTGENKTIDVAEPTSITYTRTRREATSASIQFADKKRHFAPRNVNSPYYGWLFPNVFDGRSVKRVWQFSVYAGGETWTSDWLLCREFRYTEDAENGWDASIEFTDLSAMLTVANQAMQPWESSPAKTWMARDILQSIVTKYRIPSVTTTFTDYPVRTFDFQGTTPIERVVRLLAVVGAAWRMRGATFEAFDPGWSASPRWTFTDRVNCVAFDYAYSSQTIENEVQVRRSVEANRLLAEDEQTGEAGFHTISWSPPAYNITVQADQQLGSMYTPNFPPGYSLGNGPANPSGPCDKFHFTFVPTAGALITGGQTYWHIRVYGDRPEAYGPFFAAYNQGFNVTVRSVASQALDGVLPANEPIDDPLIPNQAFAIEYGKAYLREKLAQRETIGMETLFNPFIEPWDKVSLTMTTAGITSSEAWIVQSHTFTITPDGADSKVELVKYVPVG